MRLLSSLPEGDNESGHRKTSLRPPGRLSAALGELLNRPTRQHSQDHSSGGSGQEISTSRSGRARDRILAGLSRLSDFLRENY